MKVALTVWDKRISPVFDSSQKLLIADIDRNKNIDRQYEYFNSEHLTQLIRQLEKYNVSVIICGAISEFPYKILETNSIKIIPFVSGEVDKILNAIVNGISILPIFRMPGCKGMGCQDQQVFHQIKCRKRGKGKGIFIKTEF
jgi:predicted Fe-Mo cluster-binding NifX family protein